MSYLFFTGATGLLGSYLIRDLLQAGVRLAVVVRPARRATARERVEDVVAHWEQSLGHSLPRPVVLSGDMSQPNLGMDADAVRWVADHCSAVLHNAASLTFHAESDDGEPWISNVHGTRHLLELCRTTGIRRFHHVSTAYVCGLRSTLVMEDELDVGQRHRNDYEISKFQAEQMVRSAEWLEPPTVFRPAIIVGDSRTGYTSTYHGFYVPLKILSTLFSRAGGGGSGGPHRAAITRAYSERLRQVMHIEPGDAKNYVPVDWCSAVMSRVLVRPDLHGATYHLTPRNTVPVTVMQDVFEEVVLESTKPVEGAPAGPPLDWTTFERQFLEQMQVYRTYWGDDPRFDSTRTQRCVPDLPCPVIDADLLRLQSRYAVRAGFGWPRPPMLRADVDWQDALTRCFADGYPPGPVRRIGLQVDGCGGGQWELGLSAGRIVSIRPGLQDESEATFYLNSRTAMRLANRDLDVGDAVRSGLVDIEGSRVDAAELKPVLVDLATACHRVLGTLTGTGRPVADESPESNRCESTVEAEVSYAADGSDLAGAGGETIGNRV